MNSWHHQSIAEVASQLATNVEQGLTDQEVAARLISYGTNKLRKGKRFSAFVILISQFKSLVIWVLIGAAAVSAILGETTDGIAIIAIVILNAVIGFFQEYRAEKAAAALAHLTAPHCRVVRGGHSMVVTATKIVPGDILLLEGGDLVAADARLIETSVLHANEAPLTGESQAAGKHTDTLPPATPLADRKNAAKELAYTLGQNIAERGFILITGACPGLPYECARGARSRGGLSVGISPALSLDEHVHKYFSPVDVFDALIYTGSGLMGREVTNIRSSDMVVIVGGSSGTLGEFAIAYDEGKVIGVLQGSGGITVQIPQLVTSFGKDTGAHVIYEADPHTLIHKLSEAYTHPPLQTPLLFLQ